MDDPISRRYIESDYLEHNPEWDMEDSPWKAGKVAAMLKRFAIEPKTICEVGCGAGGVLGAMKGDFPKADFTGYDIAPDAEKFWGELRDSGVELNVGDFFTLNSRNYDVILLLDVLEHVADPHQFLVKLRPYADHVVIHFPLDLSALSVLRETPLLHVRRKVGHIQFFTKGLALELLEECGLEVIDWQYTDAAFSAPQRGLKTKLFGLLRRLVYILNKDIGARLLGGETLMVLAKPEC
ncbi:bifunctional 3-demethylubiquinone-9 3-methyltransferase/ 2-octaprenyl-6-hydroxy phenol methylase [Mariprofundus micogutta]|uniref:Bifunctional 3-demethylubiquinone-9 3-methyltransferase/ 2-octaprenyl-6-hydroxy phenol methylase n=1 Tax=Mariprofundus micogutta TaxID=1921010 RepID=A0A1L8CLF1_9PROT|nr:class I SAM-dependent methyltransferase [Mariprofundus micogutta]GAV19747.1 bifunctional 3-demethylubiquinone-9 3-methyltransferase/ 2-octaprenyl-6-hydroxy phenol methylase [Mariprofundus micogutta]